MQHTSSSGVVDVIINKGRNPDGYHASGMARLKAGLIYFMARKSNIRYTHPAITAKDIAAKK